jgi:phosphoribosylanthranilate isomerase
MNDSTKSSGDLPAGNRVPSPGRERAQDSGLSAPAVKVCGLTNVEEALGCVALGVSAVGLVFFSRSPRFVTDEQARAIGSILPPDVCSVGVFVNEDYGTIMAKVELCGLRAVQLHGTESAGLVKALVNRGLIVIKSVFVNREPLIADADSFGASAFLVEGAGGLLPGGNGETWDYGTAEPPRALPFILAGGLTPENVGRAIGAAGPDAVDVSSGVEASPGRKDLSKVKAFMDAVSRNRSSKTYRRIFG